METPRKKLLQVLALSVVFGCALVSGCGSRGPDKAALEKEVLEGCNEKLSAKGSTGKCTDLTLVVDSANPYKFTGLVNFSDGTQRNVTITVDPNDGSWVTD